MMKKTCLAFLSLALAFALAACGASVPSTAVTSPAEAAGSSSEAAVSSSEEAAPSSQPDAASAPTEQAPEQDAAGGRVLIAYFSATGNTASIASHLDAVLDADLYEILPQEPYTAADLDYSSNNSRAEQEINDPTARPALSGQVENMEDYDVIFLGYPIWWGQASKVVYTFLESYDLSGKTIVPFCTSASSGIGSSDDALHSLAPDANWLDGQRFAASASQADVESWVSGLALPQADAE